jgi:y4mF family transcriptional regulator
METPLSQIIKTERKKAGLTQLQLASKAGVGLRFIRDVEQGKSTLRLDKVNLILKMFGYILHPVLINDIDKN